MDMNKTIYLYSGIISIVTSAVCAFFNYRISLGIIIGALSSFVYFYILNMNFKINEDGNISKGGILGYVVRLIVLALPLLVSCLLPNVFNIFGAFAGIMLFRIIMIIIFFKTKGEK